MSVTTCPNRCESSHADGLDEPRPDGPISGSAPTVPDDDFDVAVAAGSLETGALRVYLNVRGSSNLTPAHSRELALKLLEAASWVESHSVD